MLNAAFVPRRKNGGIKADDFARNPDIYRSDESLQEFMEDAAATVEDIKRDFARGYFAKNTGSCFGKYSQCQYTGICGSSPSDRLAKLSAFFVQVPKSGDHKHSEPNKLVDALTGESNG